MLESFIYESPKKLPWEYEVRLLGRQLADGNWEIAKALAAAIDALNGHNEVIICFSENGCFLKKLEDMEKVQRKAGKETTKKSKNKDKNRVNKKKNG